MTLNESGVGIRSALGNGPDLSREHSRRRRHVFGAASDDAARFQERTEEAITLPIAESTQ
jgi:hypothetical protein